MSQPHSPAMLRRRIGAELRALREQQGRASGDVAAALGWSASKLSRAETGRAGLSGADLRRLLDAYGVTDPQRRAELTALVERAHERAWWEGYRLQDGYRAYIGLESAAAALDMFQPQLVPGLLQTPEYARAVNRASALPEEVGEASVTARLARQEILGRERPPQVRVLLDEAVLRRPVGGPDVMRRQMLRLVEMSETDVVSIRMIPFASGAYAAMIGPFIVVTLGPDPLTAETESVVYADGLTGGLIRSRPDEVGMYRTAFNRMWAVAPGTDATSKVLRGLVEHYGGTRTPE